MFKYFPDNYVWNLSVDLALESGAQIGEIEEMCAPLREVALQGSDSGTQAFLESWVAMADRLVGLANEDAAMGRNFSAGAKLHRASLYYQTAERMQQHGSPSRMAVFQNGQNAFRRAIELGRDNIERVEIPYQGSFIPGYFSKATWGEGERPTMVFVNGVDCH